MAIPLDGYDGKRIYVWYDAVQGYLSAAVEWAKLVGAPDRWLEWWDVNTAPDARHYYFIGKDNIPFHTQIWPGMILAWNDEPAAADDPVKLHMPYDVPANEYLNWRGQQFSTSRGNVIGWNTVLGQYQADAWRYVLTVAAPENADVEFNWAEFVERVNSELVANWGNLVNRVVGFAHKRMDGVVPQPGPLDESDTALLEEIRGGFQSVGELFEAVKLKAALTECRRLSARVNQYIAEKEPWKRIKDDPQAAATSVYTALQAIDWLKTLWAPILPHSSEALHSYLGYDQPLFGVQYTQEVEDSRGVHLALRYDHTPATGIWEAGTLPPGQALREPSALFVKLDPAEVLGE